MRTTADSKKPTYIHTLTDNSKQECFWVSIYHKSHLRTGENCTVEAGQKSIKSMHVYLHQEDKYDDNYYDVLHVDEAVADNIVGPTTVVLRVESHVKGWLKIRL